MDVWRHIVEWVKQPTAVGAAEILHRMALPIALSIGGWLGFKMTPEMMTRVTSAPWDIISASTTIGAVLLAMMAVIAPVVQMETMKELLVGGTGFKATRRVRAATYAWFLVTVAGVGVLWIGGGHIMAGLTFTTLVHAVLRSGVAMVWLHWFLVAATDPDSFQKKPKATASYT